MAEFASQSYDAVMERMLSRITDEEDKRPGSPVRDLLSPYAIELAMVYIEMDNVLNLGFIDSSYGEYVDRRAAEQDLTRKPSVVASGTLTLSGPAGTEVPAGSIVSTDDDEPVTFVTLNAVIIGDSPTQVDAVSIVGGLGGNVEAGAIVRVRGDLSGVVTVTNEASFIGGFDAETDDELIARYKEKVSRPAASGNRFDYEQWAKEVAGISDAKCYPLWNGPGTVKVVVTNSERRSPSQSVIDSVITHIGAKHPIGANVTVSGVTEVPIDVSAKITLTGKGTLAQARTEIAAGITAYFRWFAFVQSVIRYTQIGNVLLEASDVLDYEDLRINGVSSNIELQTDEVPVLGALTIEL